MGVICSVHHANSEKWISVFPECTWWGKSFTVLNELQAEIQVAYLFLPGRKLFSFSQYSVHSNNSFQISWNYWTRLQQCLAQFQTQPKPTILTFDKYIIHRDPFNWKMISSHPLSECLSCNVPTTGRIASIGCSPRAIVFSTGSSTLTGPTFQTAITCMSEAASAAHSYTHHASF